MEINEQQETSTPRVAWDDTVQQDARGKIESRASGTPREAVIQEARKKLAGQSGQEYWRGLEELAETQEFQLWVEDEFPDRKSLLGVDRRDFLKFMGASMLLAGLAGCRGVFLPQQKIVPYVKAPEEKIAGETVTYATASLFMGYATGLVARAYEARPIKLDGNPDHPAIDGNPSPENRTPGLQAIDQARLLDLYDPERLMQVAYVEGIDTSIGDWNIFFQKVRPAFDAQRGDGSGIRILTLPSSSPTLAAQIAELKKVYPQMRWHQYEPINRDSALDGARMAFGEPVNTIYRFDKAKVVLSLDSEFMTQLPGSVRYAKDFMNQRRVDSPQSTMNRLYVVESCPTIVGAASDHRLAMKASEVQDFALALAEMLGVEGASGAKPKSVPDKWIRGLASDLQANKGQCLIVPGDQQSAEVHALAHAMNEVLGNFGQTVEFTDPILVPEGHTDSLRTLVKDMSEGKVKILLTVGVNPAYDAPKDVNFAGALGKVDLTMYLGLQHNETAHLCHWHLPETHFLEEWSDGLAFDGTASIVQPLISPLYDNRSLHEVLAGLLGKPATGYELVRAHWREARPGDFDKNWEKWLNDGVIPDTKLPTRTVATKRRFAAGIASTTKSGMEIVFRPDHAVWDGRFANIGWLQELPRPLTTLTWDGAAFLSPKTAETIGVANEDQVSVSYKGVTITAPVWVLPGHPDDVVTLQTGYARKRAGIVGTDVGAFNAFEMRASANLWSDHGVEVAKVGGLYALSAAQLHHSMEGRDLVQGGTLAEFAEHGKLPHKEHSDVSVFPEEVWDEPWNGSKWAMTIDLNYCMGCNACVTACQAENNIAVVGKTMVKRGREMHWIRIDRYYRVKEGDKTVDATQNNPQLADPSKNDPDILSSDSIETVFMPVNCMHCELAPCEPVCPVAATTHSMEGLNQMVYNRCVGTRYCSNNCPYKVRRFNYFNFTDRTDYPNWKQPGERIKADALLLVNNPNVTVRGRGVMEKCTYCVQRINEARITAKKERRKIRDGEVTTACQDACPSGAIIFGDISDPESRVSKHRQNARGYTLLEDLNTKPRTTYLARLRNPNPEIDKA
ncbi:MAG: TAT-variant-translocated molybdopterin oxidoreductase [Fimbriimonadaceae bacterium]|nr:TAT-variant-translocated molybdopterin oxidoreductase [Fimbriimonadaceae bacterium]